MDQIDSINSDMQQISSTNNGAIGAFLGHAYDIGVNMVLGSSYNYSFQPLPFPNRQLFTENESNYILLLGQNLYIFSLKFQKIYIFNRTFKVIKNEYFYQTYRLN